MNEALFLSLKAEQGDSDQIFEVPPLISTRSATVKFLSFPRSIFL